jgi:GNAT superfamily N-acetyltransferase
MTNANSIRVVPLRCRDGMFAEPLEAVDKILMRAYKMPSRQSRISRFLAVDQLGFVVTYLDDVLVGCGGVIAYRSGGFGWIGLIATDPDYSGRGVARAVTEYLVNYLRSVGCAAVLDGSNGGAPLYEKVGFVDHGKTVQLEYSGPLSGQTVLAPGCFLATTAEDLENVIAFDLPRFGADRSALLRYLWDESRNRWVMSTDSAGRLRGYGIAGLATIGPIVSESEEGTRALISTLISLPFDEQPRLNIPPESAYLDLIASMENFTTTMSLRHQRLGITSLPGARETVVAQCSFGEG